MLCLVLAVWVLYEFLVIESFEFGPICFINFLMGESIIMKGSWTFEYDREVIATVKIVIGLPFIVHIV